MPGEFYVTADPEEVLVTVWRMLVTRAQLKAGVDALDRGDFSEIDETDLDVFLQRLTTPASSTKISTSTSSAVGTSTARHSAFSMREILA